MHVLLLSMFKFKSLMGTCIIILQFEDLPLARSGHVLMAFALSDNLVEVTLFGGSDQNEERLSHTCILRFSE